MKINRKFGNDEEGVDINFSISDDEVIKEISNKSFDERVVFFRKLFQTDIGKTFPFNLLKGKL